MKPHYMNPTLMLLIGFVLSIGGLVLVIWSIGAYHWGYTFLGANGVWTGIVLVSRVFKVR
jgi:hypothetical protein